MTNFSTSELQKTVRCWRVLYIFTSKCAFRHSRVQFFDVATTKSAPRPSVLLTFSLQNALFATVACNFSTSQLQKMLRDRQFFHILTSESAFRHSSVQFFDIAVARKTFWSENVQNTSAADSFLKFWCRKISHGSKSVS